MVIEFEDGKIVTDLDDLDFLKLVLMDLGGYSENEVEILVAENVEEWADEMEDIGVQLSSSHDCVPDEIVLVKVGEGEWIVEDMEDEEMEDLVLLLGVNG